MAAILNLVVFELASRVFGQELSVVMNGEPSRVMEWNVIVASLIPSLIASVIYFFLTRKTQNHDKIFKIIALAGFLFSLGGPISSGVEISTKLLLSLMHLIAAFEITKSLIWDSKRFSSRW